MAAGKFSQGLIPLTTYRERLNRAISSGEWEIIERLRAMEDMVYDDGPAAGYPPNKYEIRITRDTDPSTDKPTLRINVRTMVEEMIGKGWDVEVEAERWGNDIYSDVPPNNNRFKIVIHLFKQENNPNAEVITIRDLYHQFPSNELRAKLELLRYESTCK